jgi:hypothetical protein
MDTKSVNTLDPRVDAPVSKLGAGGRLQSMMDRFAVAAEQKPGRLLAVFVLIYAIATFAHAQHRFWYDEFFTYYICRLPHLSDVMRAVQDGLDFNPPMIYLTTRLSYQILGVSPLSTRVPEMIGFLIFCFCVFVFTRRRAGTLFGFAAMCFPLLTAAYAYATEGRPYGIVLGFCGLAAISWQSATSARRGFGSFIGLALAAAGLILTHCYVVLVFAAFAIGELVRLAHRRRADWTLWFCLFAPLSIGFLYLPMLRNVKAYTVNSVSFRSGIGNAPRFYSFLFNDQTFAIEKPLIFETMWPLLIALVAICVCRRESSSDRESHSTGCLPVHEFAFLITLCLMPVYGNMLASTMHSPFIDRYALPAVFGFSTLLGILAARATSGNRRLGFGLAVGFSLWFIVGFVLWFGSLFAEPKTWEFPVAQLSALPADVPIVMSDPLMFLEANYYEPPEVASRLRFLTDHDAAIQHVGTDMFDRGYYTMRRWFPIKGRIEEYRDFRAAEKRFYVFSPSQDPENWLVWKLTQEHANMQLKAQFRYPGSHGSSDMLLEIDLTQKTP